MVKEYNDPFKRKEVRLDSVDLGNNSFKKIEQDGIVSFRRKGYEDVEIPKAAPKTKRTNKELWKEHRANKTKPK